MQLYGLFFFFLFPISFICPVLSFNDIIFVICEHYIEEGESKAPAFVLFVCLFVFSPAGFFVSRIGARSFHASVIAAVIESPVTSVGME